MHICIQVNNYSITIYMNKRAREREKLNNKTHITIYRKKQFLIEIQNLIIIILVAKTFC
jgi:hypothetical protein